MAERSVLINGITSQEYPLMDMATGTVPVQPMSSIPLNSMRVTGITQLTAAGATSVIDVSGYSKCGYGFTVAAINTNVVVDIQGTIDGTNFFSVPLTSGAMANLAITANQATVTANGTYYIGTSDIPLYQVKFNFVSESGGTAATIDADFIASN